MRQRPRQEGVESIKRLSLWRRSALEAVADLAQQDDVFGFRRWGCRRVRAPLPRPSTNVRSANRSRRHERRSRRNEVSRPGRPKRRWRAWIRRSQRCRPPSTSSKPRAQPVRWVPRRSPSRRRGVQSSPRCVSRSSSRRSPSSRPGWANAAKACARAALESRMSWATGTSSPVA